MHVGGLILLLQWRRDGRADALQVVGHLQGRARRQLACPAGRPGGGRLAGRRRNLRDNAHCVTVGSNKRMYALLLTGLTLL